MQMGSWMMNPAGEVHSRRGYGHSIGAMEFSLGYIHHWE